MNTPKHTPGPWTLNADTVYLTDRQTVVVRTIDSKGYVTRANHAQDVANAKLIAAAPDLLAALIELSEVVVLSQSIGVQVSLKKARATIAKATNTTL